MASSGSAATAGSSKAPPFVRTYAAASTSRQSVQALKRKRTAKKAATTTAHMTEAQAGPVCSHPDDDVDITGMPVELVGPPCAPDDKMLFMAGSIGGWYWIEDKARNMYAREKPGSDDLPTWACVTLSYFGGERCPGRSYPPHPHSHNRRISDANILLNVCELAIKLFVAIYGRQLKVGQLRIVEKYYRLVIRGEHIEERDSWYKKFDSTWKSIVLQRSPSHLEHTRIPGKQAPITVELVDDPETCVELTARYIMYRTKPLLASVTPPVSLGFDDWLDSPLPDRTKKYNRLRPVPGKCIFLWTSHFCFSFSSPKKTNHSSLFLLLFPQSSSGRCSPTGTM